DVLAAADDVEPVERARGAVAAEPGLDVVAHEPAAEGDRARREAAVARLRHARASDVKRLSAVEADGRVLEPRAVSQEHLGGRVHQIDAVADGDVRLDHRRLATRAQRDHDPRWM